MTAPAVGARVALTHDVERYPHFVAPAGAVGTVVDHGDPNLYAVRLDEPLEGAEEWANEVHWILDAGDDPTADLHVVTDAAEDDFVNRDALREASAAELGQIVAAGGPTALIVAAGAELAGREDDEQDRAYEIASADVVLTLTTAEAVDLVVALEAAGELALAERVRLSLDPVELVLAALAGVRAGSWLLEPHERAAVLVDAACRMLERAGVGPGSVPEGRRFVADVLATTEGLDDRRALAAWIAEEVTAE